MQYYLYNYGLELDLGSRHPVVGLELTVPSGLLTYFNYWAVLVGDETSFQYPTPLHRGAHLPFLRATTNQWALHELASYSNVPEWHQESLGNMPDRSSTHASYSQRGQLMFRKKLHGRYIQLCKGLDYHSAIYILSIAVMLGYKGKNKYRGLHVN